MEVHETFDVGAPIDRVFAFLADPRYLVGLTTDVPIAVEQLVGEGPGRGSRYRLSGPRLKGSWLVGFSEYEPPHRLRAEVAQETGGFVGWTFYDLDRRDGGTRVRMEATGRLGSFLDLGLVVMGPLYRWTVRRGNRELARKIETWSRSRDIQ